MCVRVCACACVCVCVCVSVILCVCLHVCVLGGLGSLSTYRGRPAEPEGGGGDEEPADPPAGAEDL